MAAMISLKSMSFPASSASGVDLMIRMESIVLSLCGRGASIVPSLTRRTATGQIDTGPENFFKEFSSELKLLVTWPGRPSRDAVERADAGAGRTRGVVGDRQDREPGRRRARSRADPTGGVRAADVDRVADRGASGDPHDAWLPAHPGRCRRRRVGRPSARRGPARRRGAGLIAKRDP